MVLGWLKIRQRYPSSYSKIRRIGKCRSQRWNGFSDIFVLFFKVLRCVGNMSKNINSATKTFSKHKQCHKLYFLIFEMITFESGKTNSLRWDNHGECYLGKDMPPRTRRECHVGARIEEESTCMACVHSSAAGGAAVACCRVLRAPSPVLEIGDQWLEWRNRSVNCIWGMLPLMVPRVSVPVRVRVTPAKSAHIMEHSNRANTSFWTIEGFWNANYPCTAGRVASGLNLTLCSDQWNFPEFDAWLMWDGGRGVGGCGRRVLPQVIVPNHQVGHRVPQRNGNGSRPREALHRSKRNAPQFLRVFTP